MTPERFPILTTILNEHEGEQAVEQLTNFLQTLETQFCIVLRKMFEHIKTFLSIFNICNINIAAEFDKIIKTFESKKNQNTIIESIASTLQNEIGQVKDENIHWKASVSNETAKQMASFENKNANLNHQIQSISNKIVNWIASLQNENINLNHWIQSAMNINIFLEKNVKTLYNIISLIYSSSFLGSLI